MIPCICIDDKNKPSIIPDSLWVKEGERYTISHIYQHQNSEQKGLQSCDLAELDISAYIPYKHFLLTRFAINANDLEKLKALLKDCTDMNDADISELIEILETEEVEL
jgi:hypothetical protein